MENLNNLDFLQGFQLETIDPKANAGKGGSSGPRIQKRPNEDADLRIFKNGRVYPSEQFAASFNLEYQTRVEEIDPIGGGVTTTVLGNGLDVIDSAKWVMTEKLQQRVIFIGVTPRQGNGKIDLFGSCTFDENGAPKKAVIEAGPSTFGKEFLVPLLAEVHGINWEEVPHVDVKIVTDIPMVSPNGFYIIPKVVARGADKGKPSFARRENINIFPMVVVDAPQTEQTDPNEPTADGQPQTETQEVPVQQDLTVKSEGIAENPLDTTPETIQQEQPQSNANILDELGLN